MKIFNLDYLWNDFGFCNSKSLMVSLFAPEYGVLFITLSGLATLGEFCFGLSGFTLVLLLVLVKIELITGLWAAKVRGKKIVSKKLQRFFLKMMIYFFFIMILHRLAAEVTDFTHNLYSYMHSFTIFYFVFVHIKSIAENYGRITGKKSEFLDYIKKINEKVFNSKK